MQNKPVVFDTNTLISALLIQTSISNQALKKAGMFFSIVFSKETFNELSEVVVRSKLDKYASLDDRLEFITGLHSVL